MISRRLAASLLLVVLSLSLAACGGDEGEPAGATPSGAMAPGPDATTTESGLSYEVVRPGTPGARPEPGDMVKVHYTGWLRHDGTRFQSSRDSGTPFDFTLGESQVIQGWHEGVALMDEGSTVRFFIPSALGYGVDGRPPRIPSNADLVFEIELLGVTRTPRFRPGDPARQERTPSGLVWEVIEEGTGPSPSSAQGVTVEATLFNEEGDLVFTTALREQHLVGVVTLLAVGPQKLAFLPEACGRMKVGGRYRAEVPAVLAWGDRPPTPQIRAGATTIWEFALLKVNEVPAFRPLDPERTTTTESGLRHEVLVEGEGAAPPPSAQVEVHYTGWLENGRIFDSSHGRGETTEFPLNRVVPGWTEGLQLMREGGQSLFLLPSDLAYGDQAQDGIPAGSNLIFLVELVRIVR